MISKSDERGFTLLEMMVAVMIVGLTVTTFFQLFGASLRLEHRARGFDEIIVLGRQTFAFLQARDIRKDEFPWSGEIENFSWSLRLEPVDVKPDDDFVADGESVTLRWTSELYRLVFAMQDMRRPGRHLRLVSYSQVKPGYFTDEFKEEHF
ncbi:MAG: type II secretion system protein [Deltaproteobacteria bacterium]|nr:type II secretion system protein [Candidatus Tharpella aukensis]